MALKFLSLILFVAVLSFDFNACVGQSDTNFYFTFDEDLQGLTVHRGTWKWSDMASMQYKIPPGKEGFAVYDTPREGDELYSEFIPLDYGLNYSITFFFNSKYEQGTSFALHKLSRGGEYLHTIADYTHMSSPSNNQWLFVEGYVPPEANALFSIFCQSEYFNPDGINGYLWGCAVDSMNLITGPDPTSTAPPTTTTTTPTTTTTTPTTTTTTTPTTTTTTTPTTTTTTPTTTTTEPPPPVIDFNFTSSTQGWVLGNSNGAAWRRQNTSGEYAIEVVGSPIVSSVVLATSPRLIVGDTGEVSVAVTFRMAGSQQYPAYLKVRRSYSYNSFDTTPAFSLDAFGTSETPGYVSHGAVFRNLEPGQEFFIVLEGSLGIDQGNVISVRELQLVGASPYPVPEQDFFDFQGGLVGWSQGNMDGGRWQVVDYRNIGVTIPKPTGDYVLYADRFDIFSGVMVIESPPLSTITGSHKTISARVSARGSDDYPVSLRLRAKTLDGDYDDFPFVSIFVATDETNWQVVTADYEVRKEFFQLVIEADLGSDSENFVAIDTISVTSN
ncbi:uncharacterized protein LOC108679295 [Hyalella azteca]|uniref:Uncharacterized protein LOC108679295 n=1 Tax=Hyalella azteca TaxID=294128 RepID=A0A979FIV9_HYAAZ|nr:uncharacterized protein LOC108679295 [Hyalella azteca]